MDENFDQAYRRKAQHEDEIEEAMESLKLKKAELLEHVNYLRKENLNYKKTYTNLKQQLRSLNEMLEKNAQIFHEIFNDTKRALQMGRISILNSPIQQRKPETLPEKTLKINPKPGPSGVVALPNRKLHLERLNFNELTEAMENKEEPYGDSVAANKELSTIMEESVSRHNNKDAFSTMKNVYVRISRLPCDIIREHLQKALVSNTSLDGTASFSASLEPENTSTPLKLEAMRTLGLYPSVLKPQNNNFINARRKPKFTEQRVKSEKLASVKKKKKVQNNITEMKNERTSTTIEPEESPQNRSGRSLRRVRPKDFKEPSLLKKIRRE